MTIERRSSSSAAPLLDHETPLSTSLPEELLQLILSFVAASGLKNLALVSKCAYRQAVGPLWRDVCLMDTFRLYTDGERAKVYGDRGQGEPDEHDDTPIIQKLYILAKNPFLASKVQVLTHRCHLPTPSIFFDLPRLFFHGDNLSHDERVHKLLHLAIQNMVNVHTLRVIFGHWHLTRSLLQGFLNPHRPRCIPIRKLWLESCALKDVDLKFGSESTVNNLESLRIRRLRIKDDYDENTRFGHFPVFKLSRGATPVKFNNGMGDWYYTTTEFNVVPRPSLHLLSKEEITAKVGEFDATIWQDLPDIQEYISKTHVEVPVYQRQDISHMSLLHLLSASTFTLTKLNLDWLLWRSSDQESDNQSLFIIDSLAALRFPHLRAFQVRNAVEDHTRLPNGIYLLESTLLDFMEAHPKIKCLAWPLDRFYSHSNHAPWSLARARRVVANLGITLEDLRLDTYYEGDGEPLTDDSIDSYEEQAKSRRRRFISEFAPQMTKVKTLKLEGGIPRDEKREIVRALHRCSLERMVLIGVSFPVGNTWGHKGERLDEMEGSEGGPNNLEEEDHVSVFSQCASPTDAPPAFEFEPSYGWGPSPPFLHTIAMHHASTITELKLCGYLGSPILSHWTPITRPLLCPLLRFDNLRQLVISQWLLTAFEGERRDTSIIQSWLDVRSPASTALVVVTPPASPTPLTVVAPGTMPDLPNPAARPQPINQWSVLLKTHFSPSALAYRVAEDIAPYLSPVAKEREEGVRVRASFCLGQDRAHDIFDLDIRIGRNNRLLEFVGPREEGEKGRWWDKLENRRWF
ncbi:hypothetical protein BDV96DRAFT_242073 [Lophiotrema nucula]|uniref:F-box domain-containing protein n=1 Tax=Lophiotrema nucula TaxID=690887 RepID=A0A6A5YR67_9PLEO|nr:hypothetical protein BDV96DRAFT_242073 [Lophiotrema nucula]